MNGIENFTICEWLLFLLCIAFVLFVMYPRGNGDFDEEYFQKKKSDKEKHWWED